MIAETEMAVTLGCVVGFEVRPWLLQDAFGIRGRAIAHAEGEHRGLRLGFGMSRQFAAVGHLFRAQFAPDRVMRAGKRDGVSGLGRIHDDNAFGWIAWRHAYDGLGEVLR